jgi:hypothetical protein
LKVHDGIIQHFLTLIGIDNKRILIHDKYCAPMTLSKGKKIAIIQFCIIMSSRYTLENCMITLRPSLLLNIAHVQPEDEPRYIGAWGWQTVMYAPDQGRVKIYYGHCTGPLFKENL